MRLQVAFLSLLLLAASARADKSDVRAHYQRATAHYAVGEFDEAAAEYQLAYKLHPDPALLFNAAQALRFAGKLDKALVLYRNYAHLYPDASNIADIKAQIAKLKVAIASATTPPTGTNRPADDPAGPGTASSAGTRGTGTGIASGSAATPGSSTRSTGAGSATGGTRGSGASPRATSGTSPGVVATASGSTTPHGGAGGPASPGDSAAGAPANSGSASTARGSSAGNDATTGGGESAATRGERERTPLYKRWWLWTIVGVVAAGGAVTTAVLLTQPSGSWETHPEIGPSGAAGLTVQW
jgi:hypothetical protein